MPGLFLKIPVFLGDYFYAAPCMCVCVVQNITAQKTPGRLTRNTNRNTPFRPTAAQSVAPADQTGSSVVGQVRSPCAENRSGHRGQKDSPKKPAGTQGLSSGRQLSPVVQKMTLEHLRSPSIDKSQHRMETSFVKDFGADVEMKHFNTTESDEDIAKACGQLEDEVTVALCWKYNVST